MLEKDDDGRRRRECCLGVFILLHMYSCFHSPSGGRLTGFFLVLRHHEGLRLSRLGSTGRVNSTARYIYCAINVSNGEGR